MNELKSKNPKELGITEEVWIGLAEQLLLSRELTLRLSSGPLYELHKMQLEYLEGLFGLKQELPVLDDQK